MKILHIQEYYQPQLGYQEKFLPMEHVKSGNKVWVITSNRYSPGIFLSNKKILVNRFLSPGISNHEGVFIYRLSTLFEIPYGIWIRSLESSIKKINPDVIIMHGIVNFSSLRVALYKLKNPSVKIVYDDHMAFTASISKITFLYYIFKNLFTPLILHTANAIIAVSSTAKEFMIKKYGIPENRIKIISLGADTKLFKYNEIFRCQIRSSYFINDDVVYTYCGKIIPEKGPDIFVRAAITLLKMKKNIKIFLIGGGEMEYINYIKHIIKINKCESNFIWIPTLPNYELYKYYSASDISVWPKASSLGMFEAMACSLPIIISNKSEVLERISWNNGLSYLEGNYHDLANKMEILLDPILRKKMGNNGRIAVEDNYSWEKIAKLFLNIIK